MHHQALSQALAVIIQIKFKEKQTKSEALVMKVFMTTLIAIVLLIYACGQDDDGVNPSVDPTPTTTHSPNPTPTSTVPVQQSNLDFDIEYERLRMMAGRRTYNECVQAVPTCLQRQGQDHNKLQKYCRWSCRWSCQKEAEPRSCVDSARFYRECNQKYDGCLSMHETCKREYHNCSHGRGDRDRDRGRGNGRGNGNTDSCKLRYHACMNEGGYFVDYRYRDLHGGGCERVAAKCDDDCQLDDTCSVSQDPWITYDRFGRSQKVWEKAAEAERKKN